MGGGSGIFVGRSRAASGWAWAWGLEVGDEVWSVGWVENGRMGSSFGGEHADPREGSSLRLRVGERSRPERESAAHGPAQVRWKAHSLYFFYVFCFPFIIVVFLIL